VFTQHLELTLWSGVLLIAGGFQFYRGAPDDGVIFGFGALFLIAHRFYPERFTLKIRGLASAAILAIASVIAALSRIHTKPQLLTMFLFALILLFGKRTTGVTGCTFQLVGSMRASYSPPRSLRSIHIFMPTSTHRFHRSFSSHWLIPQHDSL